MLLNVEVTGTTSPAPAPVRKVVGGLVEGNRLDSGAFDPGAPQQLREVVAAPRKAPVVPISVKPV